MRHLADTICRVLTGTTVDWMETRTHVVEALKIVRGFIYIRSDNDPALVTPHSQPSLVSYDVTSTEAETSAEDTSIPSIFADSLPTPCLSQHELQVMASRSLPYLLLLLCKIIIVSATTIFHLYTDASCQTLYATIDTDTSAGNGQCGEFTTSLNSASSAFVDDGCGGILPLFVWVA